MSNQLIHTQANDTTTYAIFRLHSKYYAIDCKDMISITPATDNVAPISGSPEYADGTITIRSQLFTRFNMRCFFHLPSMDYENGEFFKQLTLLKEDYLNWIDTLKNEVIQDKTDFTPFILNQSAYETACTYLPTFKQYFSKIVAQQDIVTRGLTEYIHFIASEEDEDERKEAKETILSHLQDKFIKKFQSLFYEERRIFKEPFDEAILALQNEDTFIALLVDKVLGISELTIIEEAEELCRPEYIKCAAKGKHLEDIILVLDLPQLAKHI